MELNTYNYCHKKTRQLLYLIEQKTHTKLDTDLSNFEQIRFVGNMNYLIIDYKNRRYLTLNLKLTDQVKQIVEEIISNLEWLENGLKYK